MNKLSTEKDSIFITEKYQNGFRFDSEVAEVFQDMLNRSIPFYSEIQELIVSLSKRFWQINTRIYDIGCSLGYTCLRLDKEMDPSCEIIGIDSSVDMVKKAQSNIEKYSKSNRIRIENKDVLDIGEIDSCSVIISSLTLQFLKVERRTEALNKIYGALVSKGVLLLVEKIEHPQNIISELFVDEYYKYKRKNGYSWKEIENKRQALSNVLIPLSVDENITLIRSVGFSSTAVVFQWCNFCFILAIKN